MAALSYGDASFEMVICFETIEHVADPLRVEQLVTKLGLSDVELLQGICPEDTAAVIPDGPLRLLHIDADVSRSAGNVFSWLAIPVPQRRGGLRRLWLHEHPGAATVVDEQRRLA